MAVPTNDFIAVLVDGSGDIVGSPEYFASQSAAVSGGSEMLRVGEIGLECYIYKPAARVTIRTKYDVDVL